MICSAIIIGLSRQFFIILFIPKFSMRILLTTHQFFPDFAAGTEVLTLSVARELSRRGHSVCVYTGYPSSKPVSDAGRFDEYLYENIRVYRFCHDNSPIGGQESAIELSYDNNLAVQYFENILLKFSPDIVHFFHLNRLGSGLIDASVDKAIPTFFTPTDFWIICHTAQLALMNGVPCGGPLANSGNCVKHMAQHQSNTVLGKLANLVPSFLFDWVSSLTMANRLTSYPFKGEVLALARRLPINVNRINRLQGVLSPNSFMSAMLTRYGVSENLIMQSPYGVDVNHNKMECVHRRMPERFRIGFIGTIAQHKGCHILIEAFKNFREGSAELRIYGRSTDFPDYFSQLKLASNGRRDISFCGVFPNSEIGCVLSEIDILVVPSLWFENTPLVVYSAHGSKCLVVASDFPGLSAVIEHGKNGLLFPPGDVEALTSTLHQLMEQPELYRQLVDNLRPPKSTMEYVDDMQRLWQRGGVMLGDQSSSQL